jgi:NSS family neurotransmitter:Na+ symporter
MLGLASLSLFGLGLAQYWELPLTALRHGGIAFFGAFLLCLLVLALPLRLLELMLGRRSRRSPLDGMAALTREADAKRGWRAAAWASGLADILALAGLALLAGWGASFLGHRLLSDTVQTATAAGLVWPAGTGTAFIVAGGLALLSPARREAATVVALLVVVLCLGAAALMGAGSLAAYDTVTPLGVEGWREAMRTALLVGGGGLGVVWLTGMRLPKEVSLGQFTLGLVGLQAVLAGLVWMALAPFAAGAAGVVGSSAVLEQIPSVMGDGVAPALLFVALGVAAVFALAFAAEPLLTRLGEKGVSRLPAVMLVFVSGAALAEILWMGGRVEGVHFLLQAVRDVLLLVLVGLSVFAGWAMKISHARKELNLPSEGLYNVWRVAVRLVVPLAVLFVFSGYLA